MSRISRLEDRMDVLFEDIFNLAKEVREIREDTQLTLYPTNPMIRNFTDNVEHVSAKDAIGVLLSHFGIELRKVTEHIEVASSVKMPVPQGKDEPQ